MNKLALALSVVLFAPVFAMADYQGSVSFDCSTNQIVQFNLEGTTFLPQHLEAQGYSVNVANNVVFLNHGNESIALGLLQKPGTCSFYLGYYTGFISFVNANLAINKTTTHQSECVEVTTDGMWGIHNAYDIALVENANGSSMELKQAYMETYSSLEQCQEALQK